MRKLFDAPTYIKEIGKLLVHAYEGARSATTPGLVGSAIETPVRNLLSSVLPRGLSVGTGCVIDSYRNTSRQMDIVLYERDICPIFRVNDTPEATYYPCEGVIAVGEIKATINGDKLQKAFKNIESAKTLKRHWERPVTDALNTKSYRNYGNPVTIAGIRSNNEEEENERDEIFAFVLAGDLDMKVETMIKKFESQAQSRGGSTCPNVLATISGGYLRPFICDPASGATATKSTRSFRTGDRVGYYETKSSFSCLVDELYEVYRYGNTTPTSVFRRYLIPDADRGPMTMRAHGVMKQGATT